MINAVKYKSRSAYNKALSSKNIIQTHEPFNIIVYDDPTPVKRTSPDIKRVMEVNDITQIPTGQAVLRANYTKEYYGNNAMVVVMAESMLKKNNIQIKDNFGAFGFFTVEIPDELSFSKFQSKLSAMTYRDESLFSVIDEDVIVEAQSCDYVYFPTSSQWHLIDIDAPGAAAELFDTTTGAPLPNTTLAEWYSRDVAIIDGSGFEIDHPDLYNTSLPVEHPNYRATRLNWDCVGNTGNVNPQSNNEKHGTAMAGLAAANWYDHRLLRGVGLSHINAQCLRIGYNHTVTGGFHTSTSIQVRALTKAIFNDNCAAIAMPYATSIFSLSVSTLAEDVRTYGRANKGIPLFAAAGNSGNDSINVFPAAYSSVLAIGAHDQQHYKADFSNYGEGLFACAPGVSIFTTDRCCGRGYSVNPHPSYGRVTYFSGTSAACVIAATIAATTMIAYPPITAAQIEHVLAATARRTGGYTYVQNGNGLPEIGVFLGTCPELGNGALTQYDAIIMARQFDQQHTALNFAIGNLDVRWSYGRNGPWFTGDLVSGGFIQIETELTITNNTDITYVSQNHNIQHVIATDGSYEPQTILAQISNVSGLDAHYIAPGDTYTYYVRTRTEKGQFCAFGGPYYIVGKYNPTTSIQESTEEDNISSVQVVFNNDPNNSLNNADCFIYNEESIPSNYRLKISNLTITPTNNMLGGSAIIYRIRATFTNMGNETFPIYGWRVRYRMFPTGNGIGTSDGYSWGNNEVFYHSTYYNQYTNYTYPYGEVFPTVPFLYPGNSINVDNLFPMTHFVSPGVLYAEICAINEYRQFQFDPAINVAYSPIIYF